MRINSLQHAAQCAHKELFDWCLPVAISVSNVHSLTGLLLISEPWDKHGTRTRTIHFNSFERWLGNGKSPAHHSSPHLKLFKMLPSKSDTNTLLVVYFLEILTDNKLSNKDSTMITRSASHLHNAGGHIFTFPFVSLSYHRIASSFRLSTVRPACVHAKVPTLAPSPPAFLRHLYPRPLEARSPP